MHNLSRLHGPANGSISEDCVDLLSRLGQGRVSEPLYAQVLVASALVLITLATVFSNSLVLCALTCGRGRPLTFSLSMTLTFSLLTSDLLLSVTVMPTAVYNTVGDSWVIGKMACRLYAATDILLCNTSIWHLAGLSLDRYLAVCRPFLHLRLTRGAWAPRVLSLALWAASALMAFPVLVPDWHHQGVDEVLAAQCVLELYETGRTCVWLTSPLYQSLVIPLSFFLPFALILGCQVPVYRVVRARWGVRRALAPAALDGSLSQAAGGAGCKRCASFRHILESPGICPSRKTVPCTNRKVLRKGGGGCSAGLQIQKVVAQNFKMMTLEERKAEENNVLYQNSQRKIESAKEEDKLTEFNSIGMFSTTDRTCKMTPGQEPSIPLKQPPKAASKKMLRNSMGGNQTEGGIEHGRRARCLPACLKKGPPSVCNMGIVAGLNEEIKGCESNSDLGQLCKLRSIKTLDQPLRSTDLTIRHDAAEAMRSTDLGETYSANNQTKKKEATGSAESEAAVNTPKMQSWRFQESNRDIDKESELVREQDLDKLSSPCLDTQAEELPMVVTICPLCYREMGLYPGPHRRSRRMTSVVAGIEDGGFSDANNRTKCKLKAFRSLSADDAFVGMDSSANLVETSLSCPWTSGGNQAEAPTIYFTPESGQENLHLCKCNIKLNARIENINPSANSERRTRSVSDTGTLFISTYSDINISGDTLNVVSVIGTPKQNAKSGKTHAEQRKLQTVLDISRINAVTPDTSERYFPLAAHELESRYSYTKQSYKSEAVCAIYDREKGESYAASLAFPHKRQVNDQINICESICCVDEQSKERTETANILSGASMAAATIRGCSQSEHIALNGKQEPTQPTERIRSCYEMPKDFDNLFPISNEIDSNDLLPVCGASRMSRHFQSIKTENKIKSSSAAQHSLPSCHAQTDSTDGYNIWQTLFSTKTKTKTEEGKRNRNLCSVKNKRSLRGIVSRNRIYHVYQKNLEGRVPTQLPVLLQVQASPDRGAHHHPQHAILHARLEDTKAIRTVVALVLSFVVCWLPIFTALLVQSQAGYDVPLNVITAFTWLGYVNSTINPLLLYRCNRSIRLAVRRLLGRRGALDDLNGALRY